MKREWSLNLKQGDWFEDHIAYPWILKNIPDYFISRCSRNKKESTSGPRLTKVGKSLVLPDFRLDSEINGNSIWIDSKLKSKSFSISSRPGEKFYSIDIRAFNDYTELLSVFKSIPLLIFLGNVTDKTLWTFNFGTTIPTWHTFNNQYGKGPTPCYSESQMECLGTWNTTGLPK